MLVARACASKEAMKRRTMVRAAFVRAEDVGSIRLSGAKWTMIEGPQGRNVTSQGDEGEGDGGPRTEMRKRRGTKERSGSGAVRQGEAQSRRSEARAAPEGMVVHDRRCMSERGGGKRLWGSEARRRRPWIRRSEDVQPLRCGAASLTAKKIKTTKNERREAAGRHAQPAACSGAFDCCCFPSSRFGVQIRGTDDGDVTLRPSWTCINILKTGTLANGSVDAAF